MGSSWISTYWDISREIIYQTGTLLVDLDGDLCGVAYLAL